MFTLLQRFKAVRRLPKLSRLIDLAKQADELLIGSNLNAETRQVLQQKREDLEEQIRAMQAA